MRRVITDGHLGFDTWTRIEAADTAVSALHGDVVVPLALWLRERQALRRHAGAVGVWLAADDEVESLEGTLMDLAVIDLQVPLFSEGRHLSTAVLLRTRLGFAGDIRAFGDIQRDQLSYMRRCGINVYCLDEAHEPSAVLAGLHVMTDYYQGDVADPLPAFRRGRSAARPDAGQLRRA